MAQRTTREICGAAATAAAAPPLRPWRSSGDGGGLAGGGRAIGSGGCSVGRGAVLRDPLPRLKTFLTVPGLCEAACWEACQTDSCCAVRLLYCSDCAADGARRCAGARGGGVLCVARSLWRRRPLACPVGAQPAPHFRHLLPPPVCTCSGYAPVGLHIRRPAARWAVRSRRQSCPGSGSGGSGGRGGGRLPLPLPSCIAARRPPSSSDPIPQPLPCRWMCFGRRSRAPPPRR